LQGNGKISAGAKTSYVTTDKAANYFSIINNVIEPDFDKTNYVLYKGTINAAYISGNKDRKWFSVQLGDVLPVVNPVLLSVLVIFTWKRQSAFCINLS
jgi:hypothetical protein